MGCGMVPIKLIKLSSVLESTALGRSRLYKLIQEGLFPAPVQLGVRSVAWDENEVNRWIEARLKAPRKLDRTAANKPAGS